ncbi:hypothetical protein [uncultured Draconibacterium sp.]|uniref:hypothetical protein n=1 Tax=uncultured Draconibacterium sp. TaxID=1573823 RepID=UPI002AA8DC8E|nr:hypothetical protein [uncultured Draconibacterium sp.]
MVAKLKDIRIDKIGQGRSGEVFREFVDGRQLAVKVFSGADDLTDTVNYLFTGAPNSYGWNNNAVKSAHYRREILASLLLYWFGSKVKIAQSYGTGWNESKNAYELQTEFISGRPVKLHQPFSAKTDWELKDLTRMVMKPLQKKLNESGFEGLVWQAGKGNPIALNNFLLDENNTWVWIDAESGVPALFPLNPFSLLGYYLLKSAKYRRPLFDDVDIGKLKNYVATERTALEDVLGKEQYVILLGQIEKLRWHQKEWKSLSRVKKSIYYQLKKGLISQEKADYYLQHQFEWVAKELLRFIKRGLIKVFYKLPAKLIRFIINVKYREILRNSFCFLFNAEYRKKSVDDLLKQRISDWEKRGQLRKVSADYLRKQADEELTSPYLADFIILIGLKPLMNVVELFVLPALFAAGLISESVLLAGVAFGGIIYRTIYTLGRMIYEQFALPREHRYPRWIALFVGMIPTFGNLAYPTQMVYTASTKSLELGEFLMYDIAARIGAKIPVWGGKDTRTEHFFNHMPDIIIRNRKALKLRKISRMRKKQGRSGAYQ